MSRPSGTGFALGQRDFLIPEECDDASSWIRDVVAKEVVATLEGNRNAPFRRSRHATTWKLKLVDAAGAPANVFLKQLDPTRGIVAKMKAIARARGAEHVLQISASLRHDRLGVPRVLLIGADRASGAEVLVMSAAPGHMLTRWMNPAHHCDLRLRRRILHRLGDEIARLHSAGYIHGDLTPYNVFASSDYQIAITFIDHESSQKLSRMSINSTRNKMRNLMQLGHFDLPGVSRTDKMRVFANYAAAMEWSRGDRRKALNRLLKMIARRRSRDHARRHRAAQPAIIGEHGVARG